MTAVWAVVWGATWGNNMAAVEWSLLIGGGAWLLRHRIGRGLAAWWARHYAVHAIDHHRQALARALAEHESRRPM